MTTEKDVRLIVARVFSEHLREGTTPEQLREDIMKHVGVSGAGQVLGLRSVRSFLEEMAAFGFVKRCPDNDTFRYSGEGTNTD
jgi:hypothetical protein